MSKKSRKMKWKGVMLNHSNIDEYMKDLIEDTAGQYITQGVSFNKDDNFQMNLLKNSILAHGSFSGFVKNLLFAYFEKNGSIDESVWQPNTINEEPTVEEDEEQNEEVEQVENNSNSDDETNEPLPVEDDEESNNESPTPVKVTPTIKRTNRTKKKNTNVNGFLPQK